LKLFEILYGYYLMADLI